MLGFRLGDSYGVSPKAVISTTPRPTAIIREVYNNPMTRVVTGSTFENESNLAKVFIKQIIRKYEGTRVGRQELYAEILEDVPGALWSGDQIDALRVEHVPQMRRVVVAIDPAVTTTAASDETGIVVCGVAEDGQGYVLDDLSGQYTPDGWGKKAVAAYDKHMADRIIAEVNNGGDMVGHTIATVRKNVSFTAVHASRGKRTRAEPIAALYEQGRIHHKGHFPQLEDQMSTWDSSSGQPSPDRMDALVWAFTELMLNDNAPAEYDASFDEFLPRSAM